MGNLSFEVTKKSGECMARRGIVKTPHGSFETPIFIPVGTKASVKALSPRDLEEVGAEAVLANTYHLMLRPGEDTVKRMGKLHKFMSWKRPILTDSGGFQAFSLGYGIEHGVGKIATIFPGIKREKPNVSNGKMAVVDDTGVTFRSHIDNSIKKITPEGSIKIQEKLGADIIFAFDECTSPLSDYEYTKKALARTHDWAKRCIAAKRSKQALFGIIQGGNWKGLRQKSAKYISSMDFDGYAVGGSLGKTKDDMHEILEWTIPLLDEEKPRHLLGIGTVEDIFESVSRGIDMFDCVGPTRIARAGMLYIKPESGGRKENKFRIRLENAKHRFDKGPIDKNCDCYACKNFSRAYLRHLFENDELLAYNLASIHNIKFFIDLIGEIRESIRNDEFKKLKNEWLKK